jgi:hypothetical protein
VRRAERLLVLVALAILPLAIAAAPSVAGNGACAQALSKDDARSLQHEARRAAGRSQLVEPSLSACIGDDRGNARYDARPERQPDGSSIEPHLVCVRATGAWSCDKIAYRFARIEGGEFQLPLDLPLEEARSLVARAVAAAPSMAESGRCELALAGQTTGTVGKLSRDFGSATFAPGAKPPWAEIMEREDGSRAVIVNGSEIVFQRSPASAGWRPKCWRSWAAMP